MNREKKSGGQLFQSHWSWYEGNVHGETGVPGDYAQQLNVESTQSAIEGILFQTSCMRKGEYSSCDSRIVGNSHSRANCWQTTLMNSQSTQIIPYSPRIFILFYQFYGSGTVVCFLTMRVGPVSWLMKCISAELIPRCCFSAHVEVWNWASCLFPNPLVLRQPPRVSTIYPTLYIVYYYIKEYIFWAKWGRWLVSVEKKLMRRAGRAWKRFSREIMLYLEGEGKRKQVPETTKCTGNLRGLRLKKIMRRKRRVLTCRICSEIPWGAVPHEILGALWDFLGGTNSLLNYSRKKKRQRKNNSRELEKFITFKFCNPRCACGGWS